MSHHSSQPDDEMLRHVRRGIDAQRSVDALTAKLGPTGRFPLGKLTPSDEGEIQLAVGDKDGKVVLDFGSAVTWIGFTPEQAEELAALLAKRVAHIRGT